MQHVLYTMHGYYVKIAAGVLIVPEPPVTICSSYPEKHKETKKETQKDRRNVVRYLDFEIPVSFLDLFFSWPVNCF